MAEPQHYCLKWNNYLRQISCALDNHRAHDEFVDVTLLCEGRKITAHKVVLSSCSSYFKDIFSESPHPHPLLIFNFIKYENLNSIIKFMYQGEVNVKLEGLDSFLQLAKVLSVHGLNTDHRQQKIQTLLKVAHDNQAHRNLSTSIDKTTTHPTPSCSQSSYKKRKLADTDNDNAVSAVDNRDEQAAVKADDIASRDCMITNVPEHILGQNNDLPSTIDPLSEKNQNLDYNGQNVANIITVHESDTEEKYTPTNDAEMIIASRRITIPWTSHVQANLDLSASCSNAAATGTEGALSGADSILTSAGNDSIPSNINNDSIPSNIDNDTIPSNIVTSIPEPVRVLRSTSTNTQQKIQPLLKVAHENQAHRNLSTSIDKTTTHPTPSCSQPSYKKRKLTDTDNDTAVSAVDDREEQTAVKADDIASRYCMITNFPECLLGQNNDQPSAIDPLQEMNQNLDYNGQNVANIKTEDEILVESDTEEKYTPTNDDAEMTIETMRLTNPSTPQVQTNLDLTASCSNAAATETEGASSGADSSLTSAGNDSIPSNINNDSIPSNIDNDTIPSNIVTSIPEPVRVLRSTSTNRQQKIQPLLKLAHENQAHRNLSTSIDKTTTHPTPSCSQPSYKKRKLTDTDNDTAVSAVDDREEQTAVKADDIASRYCMITNFPECLLGQNNDQPSAIDPLQEMNQNLDYNGQNVANIKTEDEILVESDTEEKYTPTNDDAEMTIETMRLTNPSTPQVQTNLDLTASCSNAAATETEGASSADVDWDLWSSDNSDVSDDEELMIPERRQYNMYERLDHFNKWDDSDFFRRFRLRKQTVAHILHLIRPKLQDIRQRSRNITPMAKLLIALRFYALGSMLTSVGEFSGVSTATVSVIIQQVSFAVASLRKHFIKMPQSDGELSTASDTFYDIAKFPRTIGAIDCTHMKIQSPGGDNVEHFRNRKGFFSLNVQSVSSADLKFLNIVARWPGSCHDQTIFNNSVLKMQFERKDFKNYILVGDSGYAATPYLATPLLQCTNPVEELYNESIIKALNVVERQYRVWKRRFQVMLLPMRVKIETVQDIIVATAILHNIAVDFNEEIPPDDLELYIPPDEPVNVVRIEEDQRDNIRTVLLADYFPALHEANRIK